MRMTLKEFEKEYNPITIQLLFGKHIVNIDTRVEGSFAIFRAFESYNFNLINYDESFEHLYLEY